MDDALPDWLEGFAALEDASSPRIPILILDAFALEPQAGRRVRFAVVGCVEGELRLVPESLVNRLPEVLLAQWRRVASRDGLRTVRATDFVLAVMDAFDASPSGLRVWARAMLRVRVGADGVDLAPLEHRGEVRVSRAAAAVAVAHSARCAFDNPRTPGEVTHHWWFGLAAPEAMRAGRGLLLAYTVPDPAMFDGADNRAVWRTIRDGLGSSDVGSSIAADPSADALHAFLEGETLPSTVATSPAPPAQPRARSLPPPQPPVPVMPPAPPRAPAPRAAAPAGTFRAMGTYPASKRDWSNDFEVTIPKKAATRSGWWRDFAPEAVSVEGLYTPRQGAHASNFSDDFGAHDANREEP